MCDFLIVGGGINGLLLARELAQAKAQVVLVERGFCGKEASWAGGGIISPLYPWKYSPEITALASWAQDFYPALVEELLGETGIDAELQTSGLLMLDADNEELALAWARDNARRMERLEPHEIISRETNLNRAFSSALWMPDVANVRNPRLIQALVASLKAQANVSIVEHATVTGFEKDTEFVRGINVLQDGVAKHLDAGAVIVSAGAWTGSLLGSVGIDLPIEPVKGQMLLFEMPQHTVNSIVLSAGRYLIPRRDGLLLAGSTLEYSGFDKTATDEARADLLQSARLLLPALAEVNPIGHWAGLRPGAPQGIPFIGKLPSWRNMYVNAGQFRNGLVLAPASARLLADSLLNRNPILDPTPYTPEFRVQGSECGSVEMSYSRPSFFKR